MATYFTYFNDVAARKPVEGESFESILSVLSGHFINVRDEKIAPANREAFRVVIFENEEKVAETELSPLFRSVVSGSIPDGTAWLTPLSLDGEPARWMTDNLTETFLLAKEAAFSGVSGD